MASYPWLRGGSPARPAQATRAVRLQKIYPPPENESRTDIDIIAIHGLDTNSEETWVWDPKGDNVNWLKQSDMLPEKFPSARIFTCDWPTDLFEESDYIQKEFEEFARLLLAGIKHRPQATDGCSDEAGERPIVFIASCLGGVILMKALVMASHEYQCVRQATRGIVFLATPFRGTSFQDVARWAEPGLSAWASIRGKKISNLLELVKSSSKLGELVRSFTALCQEDDLADHIVIFYETGNSSLPRKVAPWLPQYLAQEKPLVDSSSASLDIVQHPLALNRRHVLMNKFSGPHDPDYETVAERINYLLDKIQQGRPIERADGWIRTKRYSLKELQIERLSGDVLPMDRCYINLALVEHSAVNSKRADEDDASQKASPFSLSARLKIERPDKAMEVTLPALFEPRQARDGQKRRPNRILIRGRAGVGKTTLCKKIIHDFTYGQMWQGLFDRVLWVPLRNLKREERRRSSKYNFGSLFHDEYFSQHPKGEDLAEALWDTLPRNDKTLLILDGLDEVSQDLDGSMLVCFKELLDQPNVIITSRPHTMFLRDTKDVDLELETIGFYPYQVKDYVKNAFTDPETDQTNFEKVSMIQSYLQQHPLVQGLVRIPVQLDALCFTWETWERSNDQDAPKTMTAVYQAIEHSLWKKDVVKLGKLTEARALGARPRAITSKIEAQRQLLEYLAFTGIYNNLIEFESKHCDAIDGAMFTDSDSLLDETLKCVSFLRASGPLLTGRAQSYHFLHLTYQEYFAARYFVRQWKANKKLEYITFGSTRNRGPKPENLDPVAFLQREKYKSRYDIFWRFVAGLLNVEEGDEEASRFFDAIEEEPLDILGPTHQRLVMHCLSELRTEAIFRKGLEDRLLHWLPLERRCAPEFGPRLVSEMEFPVSVLARALRASSEKMKIFLLRSLLRRPAIELGILELVASVLEDDSSDSLICEVLDVLGRGTGCLPNSIISIIASQLGNADRKVKVKALGLLGMQPALALDIFQQVAAKLGDDDERVRMGVLAIITAKSAFSRRIKKFARKPGDEDESARKAALSVLASKSALSPEILKTLTEKCDERTMDAIDLSVVVTALGEQSELTPVIVKNISALLEDKVDMLITKVSAAVKVLDQPRALTPEAVMKVAVWLKYAPWLDRQAAVNRLVSQSAVTPEILQKFAAAKLEDEDYHVRQVAVEILASQSALTLDILQEMAARIEDPAWRVKFTAAKVLACQSALPSEILENVTARLANKDKDAIWVALKVLASQSALPTDVLRKIIARLEDGECTIREVAYEALVCQSALTLEILQEIAAKLGNEYSSVRRATLKLLASRSALAPEILQEIAAKLGDEDSSVRCQAVQILIKQTPETLEKVTALLADGSQETKGPVQLCFMSLVLRILMVVGAELEDEFSHFEMEALGAHARQLTLTLKVFKECAAQLETFDRGIEQEAVKMLANLSALTRRIIARVAEMLEYSLISDKETRAAAVMVLVSELAPTPDIFQEVAPRLEHPNKEVRSVAAQVITELAPSLETIGPYLDSFYRALLERSFSVPVSWFNAGGFSYMIVDERVVSLGRLPCHFTEVIQATQRALGSPLSR